MFPITWTEYIISAAARNVSPCWVDIVGNSGNPAAYYARYDDTSVDTIAFRMRLNGDPIKNNPNTYELQEFVWGVQIVDLSNNLQFTVRVNASGNEYNLQILNSSNTLLYDVPIAISSPEASSDNVRVLSAGSVFPCTGSGTPDNDFYLDFKVPVSEFDGFDFDSGNYRYCYFTSTQDNSINKDRVCGTPLNPEAPQLLVIKEIIEGPLSVCVDEVAIWKMRITVSNTGETDITDIVLSDTINSSLNVISISPAVGPTYIAPNITWNIGTLVPSQQQILEITATGSFDTPGQKILDSGTVSTTGLIINFSDTGINVSQIAVNNSITVSGELKDCSSGVLLDYVLINIYQNCKIIKSQIFSKNYDFVLEPGIYTLEFVKEEYQKRFLALILESDMDVRFDVCLCEKKKITILPKSVAEGDTIDLFMPVIKETLNIDIIYNKLVCVCENSQIENVSDVIDSITSHIVCGKKFILRITLEKNVICKKNGIKELKTYVKTYNLCFPISKPLDNYEYKYKAKINKVKYCQDEGKLYNFAHIKYVGYFICYEDINIDGEAIKE